MQELREWLDDRNADQPGWLDWLGGHWISYAVTALLGAIGIMVFVGGALLALIWIERRLIGRMQIRRGRTAWARSGCSSRWPTRSS